MIIGTKNLINSIMMKAPITLPNSRMHSDNGLMNISRTLIGATTGTGSARSFAHPRKPFWLMPEYSMRHMLMMASAAVMFKSLVGGLNPRKLTTVLAKARKISTDIR